jgi:hypothetical protein
VRRTAFASGLLALTAALVACVEINRPSDADCAASDIALALAVSEASMTPDDPAVCRGQHVTLTVESTVDGYLHVHGYDAELPVIDVRAGRTVEAAFDAARSGQFPVELHTDENTQGVSLGVLTVHEP